jgi:hypothetical protein
MQTKEQDMQTKEQEKKVWITPKLIVHGDVKKITMEMPGHRGGLRHS